jgi:hypothetical protein
MHATGTFVQGRVRNGSVTSNDYATSVYMFRREYKAIKFHSVLLSIKYKLRHKITQAVVYWRSRCFVAGMIITSCVRKWTYRHGCDFGSTSEACFMCYKHSHMSTTGTLPSYINTGHSLFPVKFITYLKNDINWPLMQEAVIPYFTTCGSARTAHWTTDQSDCGNKSFHLSPQSSWVNDFGWMVSLITCLSFPLHLVPLSSGVSGFMVKDFCCAFRGSEYQTVSRLAIWAVCMSINVEIYTGRARFSFVLLLYQYFVPFRELSMLPSSGHWLSLHW